MEPGGPGWNDPPKLSYKISSETKSRRHLLNKRVAYLDHPPNHNEKEVEFPVDRPPPTQFLNTNVVAETTDSQKVVIPPINMFIPSDGLKNVEKIDSENIKESTDESGNALLEDINVESDDSKLDVIAVLLTLTRDCEHLKNKNATNDIRRKVEILRKMLDNNELSEDTVTKMNKLSKHLLHQRYQAAWDIHVSLMCDHISEVSLWMVGIKRLINELKGMS